MKTIEQLEAELVPAREEYNRVNKLLKIQSNKINKLNNAINKIKVEGILGTDEITLENIMKLEWHLLQGSLYKRVSEWLYKNIKYAHQSGYQPDAGCQAGFTIKMDRGHDIEPQVKEITEIIDLTNPATESMGRRKPGEPKGNFKYFNMFVSSQHDDEHISYSLRVYEGGKAVTFCNSYVRDKFDTVYEALCYIHKRLWYQDS